LAAWTSAISPSSGAGIKGTERVVSVAGIINVLTSNVLSFVGQFRLHG
jgi:hypothetical protein